MTRQQEFNMDVKTIITQSIRSKMPEAKMLDAHFCNDLPESQFRWSWSESKIASGLESKWISDNGLVATTKKGATCLLVIGTIGESGCFEGKCKNYWLKPK